MKVNNTIPLLNPHLVDCLTDGVTIKLIGSGSPTDIVTLDPESLGLVSRLSVETDAHNFYISCIDDDCVYLPTKLGQILALDKFSGEILATINLGMPIMSNIIQDNQNVYCICGVPLSRKRELVFINFCVCICDKETGKKKIQTSYFEGDPSALIKDDDSLWVVGGEYLIQYSSNGEYLRKTHLGPNFEYPLITKDLIICVSTAGFVRSLDKKTLKLTNLIQAQSRISKPFLVNEVLVWVTPTGICHVNLKEGGFRNIETNKEMLSDSLLSSDETQLFTFDKSGSIISFDLNTHAIQSIKLTNSTLRMPVIIEEHLLVTSATQLHQLKVD